MVNADNLRPPRSTEEARVRGAAGGRASGKARRRKREFRRVLEELLVMDSEDLDGMSNIEAICVALCRKAQAGDVGAATWVRDTCGQKPTDKLRQEGLMPGTYIYHWQDAEPAWKEPLREQVSASTGGMFIEEEADHARIEEQQKRKPRPAAEEGPAQQERQVTTDDPYAPKWGRISPEVQRPKKDMDIFDV